MKEKPSELPEGCLQIAGFPFYCVRSDGAVFSCRTRGGLFRPWTPMVGSWNNGRESDSRMFVSFHRDGKLWPRTIHRLVLEAFVGPCPEGLEGCHNDGNPEHNHVGNLRWDTHASNMADRKTHGKNPEGERNPAAVLNADQVKEIRELWMQGVMQKALAPIFGVSKQCIQTVCSGTCWMSVS